MTCENLPPYDPQQDALLAPELRALIGIDAIYNQVLAMVEQMSLHHELPDAAKRLLIRLDAPARPGDLARASNVLPSTMTALVDLLEAQGLLERNRDPSDRRAWLLSLTPKGRAKRAEMAQKAAEVFHIITGFNAEDTAAFAELTDKARKNLHETLSNRSRK